MAKKRRNPDRQAAAPVTTVPRPDARVAASPASIGSATALPSEVIRGDWTVPILAVALFLAPALGVPHEEMLQDTLKSIVIAFAALGAGLLFFLQQRNRDQPLRWHAVLWLPLLLMAYALGSMAWSHTFLGGVEAIRWFVFSVLLWLGLNTLSRERLPLLALGIHWGAVIASLWTMLQFWVDLRWFPQGPNPASTFVNRNFFAEYAACTLPFSALLLARARQSGQITLLAVTTGMVIVAVLMTGTRSALAAMWLQLLLVLPLVLWLYRTQLPFGQWDGFRRVLGVGLLVATVLGLGLIPTGNAKIQGELRGTTAIERGLKRTASISSGDSSLGIRVQMWKATVGMIEARPLTGVGAGAWESEIPRHQSEGSQLETDYYVHNEFLQLLAEYGLVGWIFLLLLFAYLLNAARRTVSTNTPEAVAEAPYRALLLCSLLALFVVSNAGFPWRMAATGALFAACLAALAASDARLGFGGRGGAATLRWTPVFSQAAIAASLACLLLATYITHQASRAEEKIVKATKMAMTISASGNPNSPAFARQKSELLRLIREGVQINPHYRKITPMVADELARWGDWENATWIWESVLSSRPHIVAILTNVARGHASTDNPRKALEYLERAKQIQPQAPAVRSLEVILLSRMGKENEALALARDAVANDIVDFDLLNAGFLLAWRSGDYPLALKMMELKMAGWPDSRASGYAQLGNMYATGLQDQAKALESFRKAVELTPAARRASLKAQIPATLWAQVGLEGTMPAAATQTSVISK